jgi:hypothetical protein
LLLVAACLLVAGLVGVDAPADEPFGDAPARAFVDDSLRAIGAQKTPCPDDVLEEVQTHRMKVVCARFEGTFERFQVRWGLQMIQAAGPEDGQATYGRPPFSPQEDWERNGSIYDRIYVVGDRAVGVRFAAGDILMVW